MAVSKKLVVPEVLNRNAKNVRKMGDPADTGLMLIEYMCDRIGIRSLKGLDVLDFGCGTRFSESIVNRDVAVGTYTGVDVNRKVISFLQSNVKDPRLSYVLSDARNQLYNPRGSTFLGAESPLLAGKYFDLICMFSVITHQQPAELVPILQFTRDRLRTDGRFFFSAFIHADESINYQELDATRSGRRSSYSFPYLSDCLVDSGFKILSHTKPRPNGLPIMDSILCVPNQVKE